MYPTEYTCNECDLEVCVVPWFCKYHTRSEVEKVVNSALL